MDTAREFWSHVRRVNRCWVWDLSIRPNGYGQVNWCGRIRYAHHVAWELKHGPIPKGMHVLHTCDTKACQRPSHLYLGTRRDNTRDFFTRQWHKHNVRKLTPNDVRMIRQMANEAGIHDMPKMHRWGERWTVYRRIARRYTVAPKAIQRIIDGISWKHLT